MEISKEKIAIITTVYNWDLYHKTKHFFPKNIQIFAVDGRNSLYGIKSLTFFLKKLRGYNIDWLIMADEDIIFSQPEKVFDLIQYLAVNNYTVSGMSEADRYENWSKHPYVINTFFGVLHLKEIYEIYEEQEMLKNQYAIDDEFTKADWMPDYNHKKNSLAESYYCFFLYLLRKGKKTKFLPISRTPDDELTTIVHDHTGKAILYHTWYARYYNKDKTHTQRINKCLQKGKYNNPEPEIIVFKNYFHDLKFSLYKYYQRIKRYIRSK